MWVKLYRIARQTCFVSANDTDKVILIVFRVIPHQVEVDDVNCATVIHESCNLFLLLESLLNNFVL